MTRIGSLVIAALALAAPLAGQGSRSADSKATLVISRALSLAKFSELDFGIRFASEGVVTNSGIANWSGTTDAGSSISLAFATLPTQLTRLGGSETITVTYGANSGSLSTDEGVTLSTTFNPTTGLGPFEVSSGVFNVYLGHPQRVTADLTGKPAGTYEATITLTVTVQ
jgi:hypothetical protein